jgi:hypothetical protein
METRDLRLQARYCGRTKVKGTQMSKMIDGPEVMRAKES